MNLNKLKALLITSLFSFFSVASDNADFEQSRFNLEVSQKNLQYIHESLNSFRELTQLSSDVKISKVDNTSWEIQNVGFDNWINSVQGSLLTQELEIAKLSLKLEKKTNTEHYEKAKQRVREAQDNLDKFLSGLIIKE